MNKSNFSHLANLNASCLCPHPYFLIKAFYSLSGSGTARIYGNRTYQGMKRFEPPFIIADQLFSKINVTLWKHMRLGTFKKFYIEFIQIICLSFVMYSFVNELGE